MKNKILLSTLLGGALLAACTADDALDVKEVAGGVNPAAPVFRISFNDGSTRANTADDGITSWVATDKMSLFHGGGQMVNGNAEKFTNSYDFLKEDESIKKFDAIYTNVNDGETTEFRTEAMVNEGLAIMVYPADLAYDQDDNNPHIRISKHQVGGKDKKIGERTRDSIPAISEVLNITKYTGDDDAHEAGYGRKYNLNLRRIGAGLRLQMVTTGAEAIEKAGITEDIEYTKVDISVDGGTNGEANPFTTDMKIRVGQVRGTVGKTDGSSLVGRNNETQTYWKYSPWITVDKKVNEITTTDIIDGKTAFFSLLPPDDTKNTVFDDSEDKITESDNGIDLGKDKIGAQISYSKPKFSKANIIVRTNYGKVNITSENNKYKWRKGTETGEGALLFSLENGLAEALSYALFYESTDTKYKGQILGASGTRYLTVDLTTLDMNGLHVKNQTNLQNVLKVYEAVAKNTNVTLILDGEGTETDQKKFVMSATTWKQVEETLERNKNLKLALCNDERPCTKIVLDNTGNEDVAEVPELHNFATSVDGEKVQSKIEVELVGAWKYTSVTNDINKDDRAVVKNLTADKLTVAKGANLQLQNYIKTTKPKVLDIVVENGATVTASGSVTLQENLMNFGEINIGTADVRNDQLAVDEGCKLWNREIMLSSTSDLTESWWTKQADKGGVINVTGTLAIVSGSTGKIYNRGVINMNHKDAVVLISNNQDGKNNAKIGDTYQPSAKDNATQDPRCRFGTINLNGGKTTGEVTLTVQENLPGFIKYNLTTGTTCAVANYCVVDKNDFPTTESGQETTHIGLKYIEVTHTGDLIYTKTYNTSLDALIVPSNVKIYIPSGTSLSLSSDGALYVNGTVTHGIDFLWTDTQRKNYFGDGSKGGVYSAGLKN